MNDTEILEQQIREGKAAESFLQSPLGRYLLERSKDEIDAAVDELKRVDPEDSKEIRRLQNVIARNESVESWIAEVIGAGREALDIVQGTE